MWTGNHLNTEYSAQIFPYGGQVHAEIISSDKNKDKGLHSDNFWLTVCEKSFGRFFNSAPREKDWIRAAQWVQEQMDLIEKYGTVLVKKPEVIRKTIK